jgi:hypothetical protein
MQSKARSVKAYLDSLPADRQAALRSVRDLILKNLPKGYEEAMNWGAICYQVPLKVLPQTYNRQPLCYAALANQKNFMTVYLMCVYGDKRIRTWFEQAYKASGKKLEMGKSCVHFKKLDDLPLDVIGQAIARVPMEKYVQVYEASRAKSKKR